MCCEVPSHSQHAKLTAMKGVLKIIRDPPLRWTVRLSVLGYASYMPKPRIWRMACGRDWYSSHYCIIIKCAKHVTKRHFFDIMAVLCVPGPSQHTIMQLLSRLQGLLMTRIDEENTVVLVLFSMQFAVSIQADVSLWRHAQKWCVACSAADGRWESLNMFLHLSDELQAILSQSDARQLLSTFLGNGCPILGYVYL